MVVAEVDDYMVRERCVSGGAPVCGFLQVECFVGGVVAGCDLFAVGIEDGPRLA